MNRERAALSRNMVLLRIGVDSGAGGIQSPLHDDGTFDLICIPSSRPGESYTYGTLRDRAGRPLTRYIGDRLLNQFVHLDPDFATMTYGDPNANKRGLLRLRPGDYLVFTCGLQRWSDSAGWDAKDRPGIYIAGYFVVDAVGTASDLGDEMVHATFAQNAHVRDAARYQMEREKLTLVKGGLGSRALERAVCISEFSIDKAGKPLKSLSTAMQKVFGPLGGKQSLQRSNPRWLESEFVDSAVSFLQTLR